MIRSALIFAPHQDDELNIAGSLLDQMVSAGMKIIVCFLTNGDWCGEQERRLREAKKVASLCGISHIIYLGYGDGGFAGSLYDAADDDTIVPSPAGKSETYGIGDMQDFHFLQHGTHASYTKRNVREDIKEVLLSVRADLVFCVDKDEHPDHKLLSEEFDTAVAEIVAQSDYRPLVLKAFAYLGVFYGANDYFIRPMRETKCASYGKWGRTNSNPYQWNERVRFAVSRSVYPLAWWKSPLFKALHAYKTQRGVKFFPRICNADAVYWFYDTTNGTYKLSKDFPIWRTPFHFYSEDSVYAKNHRVLSACYAFYLLAAYRIPGKLRRIVKNVIAR